MTNRMNILVAVALAASAFACDRNTDDNAASETNTTSATVTPNAADQAGAPVITEQTTPSEAVTTTATFRAKAAGGSGALTSGVVQHADDPPNAPERRGKRAGGTRQSHAVAR